MAQGDFTQEEAEHAHETVNEIMDAFPDSKTPEYLGHFNDVLLFLETAKQEAPSEEDSTE